MTTTEPAAPNDVDVAPEPDPNAVEITVDGVPVTARKGELLIEAIGRADVYVPRFCYHERMTPVGKCRMCLVECDSGRGPAVTVSCMVPVAPGMVVDTQSDTTKRMQEGMLELLLANHPLDCPVCDKGGECPLQDQAYSHGPGESRFVEEKRHYEKPIPISDLVFLDRERCILCDRCTRFADEVAGDPLIHFTGRGNNTYIATYPDEPFSSYFSGNTVQICPVGALTAAPYRFKARPWDLDESESTCTTCSVGCRTVVQSSRDELVRTMGVDSDPVNWGWLCDRGRFDFQRVAGEQRLREPLVKVDGEHVATSWNSALSSAAALLRDADPSRVAVLGGARGTNEDAFAWARLAHDVVGTPHVSAQLADGLPSAVLGLPRANIAQAATASTIVLLGADLKEELPVLYLRLRDAVQRHRSRIVEFTSRRSGLSAQAWRVLTHEPGGQRAAVERALADADIAAQLQAGPVVVVVGRGNLAEDEQHTVAALQALLAGVPGATVLPALRRGNVVGATQLGLRPGAGGLDAHGILDAAANGSIDVLVLLGADPLSDVPDTDLARRALLGARHVIAVDAFPTASVAKADVVLPVTIAGEQDGTTTNLEGRVTTVSQQVTPAGTTRPDWMVAVELALELGYDLGVATVGELTAAIADAVPSFAPVTADALAGHTDGVLTDVPSDLGELQAGAPAVSERNSYDFRVVVSRTMYDLAVGTQQSPALAPLARGAAVHVHPLDIERIGAHDGDDVKVTSSRASLVFRLVADDAVLRGTAWLPFNQPGPNVGELIDASASITDVRLENL
jgi:NADH-quinone oxidoreductase subunit G